MYIISFLLLHLGWALPVTIDITNQEQIDQAVECVNDGLGFNVFDGCIEGVEIEFDGENKQVIYRYE